MTSLHKRLLLEVLPAHNEAIPGDSLYSIQLNYKWRLIIAQLLHTYFLEDDGDISYDNQNYLSALIEDLYNAETLNMQRFFDARIFELPANFTTTSSGPVKVTGSGFNYTPTHNRLKITCYNAIMNNTAANGYIGAQVRFNAAGGMGFGGALMFGTSPLSATIEDIFIVTPNVEHEVAIYIWRLVAGTAQFTKLSHLTFLLEEWDE